MTFPANSVCPRGPCAFRPLPPAARVCCQPVRATRPVFASRRKRRPGDSIRRRCRGPLVQDKGGMGMQTYFRRGFLIAASCFMSWSSPTLAVPVNEIIHESTENYFESGGTFVTDCFGQGCSDVS